MNEPIVEISHLTKTFTMQKRRYGLKNIFLHLPDFLRSCSNPKLHTALDDISFSVQRGERVGLTGHNGCGKTTLLSVIGNVYKSYSGTVNVRGSVAMMLALGAGMHPELTGRENIMLNGILLGKRKKEMEALIDDIIDFADLGDYIDAPLYQYSSGMKARIGFGVATAVNPDILLVDEVMAVGDAEFKRKSEKRIDNLLENGCTLFLVSHSTADLKKYCSRIIKMDHGRIIADGTVDEVLR